MEDIYKFAAQNQLRFPSDRGDLTVEQLFSMPLEANSGCFDLDTVARTIDDELQAYTEKSFVKKTSLNPAKARAEVALEIVKDVIATKQAENDAALAKIQKAAKKAKLLDLINAKENEAMSAASKEELEKQLAELG